MSYSNGVVKDTGANDGASVYDVQRALNVNYNQLKDLCTHYSITQNGSSYDESGINKYAAFKPIKRSGLSPLSMYQIIDSKFGLKPLSKSTAPSGTVFTIGAALMNYTSSTSTISSSSFMFPYMHDMIAYELPEGTINSPYRINDFSVKDKGNDGVGYYHNAALRYSYMDSNSNWHGISVRYGRGTTHHINLSTGTEDLSADVDWQNYNDYKFPTDPSYLTAVNNSVLIHDIYANYQQWKKGIAFMKSNTDGEIVIFVGTIDWDNTILRSLLQDRDYPVITMEFLTPQTVASGTYTFSTQSNITDWVALPGSGGYVTTDEDISYVDADTISDFASISLGKWDMGCLITVDNADYWDRINVLVAHDPNTASSDLGVLVNITHSSNPSLETCEAQTLIDLSFNASGASSGETLYINVVGYKAGTSTTPEYLHAIPVELQ